MAVFGLGVDIFGELVAGGEGSVGRWSSVADGGDSSGFSSRGCFLVVMVVTTEGVSTVGVLVVVATMTIDDFRGLRMYVMVLVFGVCSERVIRFALEIGFLECSN
ncbi:hypothetical protein Acr_01g0012920 [Actinidia rufa]|uniref:Uncharacterized protein n=1 Tax=Actinidia rufa TaxID=165716 RepID=A0A7J0E4R1_9ERIC|nr:hypothetical protein Acr_01g0012920 [Actinidia rufa]